MTVRETAPIRGAHVGPAATWFACSGCGWRAPDGAPVPLICPAAVREPSVDHVLVRRLDPAGPALHVHASDNPFVAFRELFHAWQAARRLGWTDADFVALVERLDGRIAAVDGHGFRTTPFARSDALSERLGLSGRGGVWVKDETGNVSGSHKARHLFGTLLELEVQAAIRARAAAARAADALAALPAAAAAVAEADPAAVAQPPAAADSAATALHSAAAPTDAQPALAIASCGNAALAAAVVARAAGRPLQVYIPPDADPAVVARLRALGARLEVCERRPGVPGDPTYHRLLAALADGALPFTCQGNLNAFAVEGGETLALEMAAAIGAPGGPARIDRVVVQVGGGALASGLIAGFASARMAGLHVGEAGPRFDTVQTSGAHPLARAHDRVAALVAGGASIDAALTRAAGHRAEFMWPWEDEPRSIAHGILDDETYDWVAVVRGMLETGGSAVIVDEPTLEEANALARETTGIDVDHTGSSGLAGLLHLARDGGLGRDETIAITFSGIRRTPEATPAVAAGSARDIPTNEERGS